MFCLSNCNFDRNMGAQKSPRHISQDAKRNRILGALKVMKELNSSAGKRIMTIVKIAKMCGVGRETVRRVQLKMNENEDPNLNHKSRSDKGKSRTFNSSDKQKIKRAIKDKTGVGIEMIKDKK